MGRHAGLGTLTSAPDDVGCPAAIQRAAGEVSGARVFKNTRVSVRALFEDIEDGATVNELLASFPGVTREHVEAVLDHAERSLAAAESFRPQPFTQALWDSMVPWICASGSPAERPFDDGQEFPHVFRRRLLAGEGAEEGRKMGSQFLVCENVVGDAAGIHGGVVE